MKIRIHSWPLDMKTRTLEARFRRRKAKHGPLVLVPRDELSRLIERAETVCRQLELPLDVRDSSQVGTF